MGKYAHRKKQAKFSGPLPRADRGYCGLRSPLLLLLSFSSSVFARSLTPLGPLWEKTIAFDYAPARLQRTNVRRPPLVSFCRFGNRLRALFLFPPPFVFPLGDLFPGTFFPEGAMPVT